LREEFKGIANGDIEIFLPTNLQIYLARFLYQLITKKFHSRLEEMGFKLDFFHLFNW